MTEFEKATHDRYMMILDDCKKNTPKIYADLRGPTVKRHKNETARQRTERMARTASN